MFSITDSIKYVGVNDKTIDLFEGQYPVPDGISYNSYAIIDEKIAILDAVEKQKIEDWLDNVEIALDGRIPDFLVISHMEPDHSGGIRAFIGKYPSVAVVGNERTFAIATRFFGDIFQNKIVVKDGDELALGEHVLKFIFAPMVHWPEVMFTYDKKDKALFTADAFGKFGTSDWDEDWTSEARRYYFNIIGKYGPNVQNALKKIATLDVEIGCPLHGPVLKESLGYYLGKYNLWSSYLPEYRGVLIAYSSVYGNTADAAKRLAQLLRNKGERVATTDLARDDISKALANAFRYDRLVLASVTYDGGLFPATEKFLNRLKNKNYQNRKVALIENGSWAPMSGKLMRAYFEGMTNIEFVGKTVSIQSAITDETDAALKSLAEELVK